jgi:hypothetical protein
MELSHEGLAAAKETRETAARRRNEQAAAADAKQNEAKQQQQQQQQHTDKKAKPTPRELPPVSHEVAFPVNYDRTKTTLDPEQFGGCCMRPSYSLHLHTKSTPKGGLDGLPNKQSGQAHDAHGVLHRKKSQR